MHCIGGRDRTGLVAAHFLCSRLGLSPKDGLTAVRERRPDAMSAEGWEEMGLSVIETLLNEDNDET
jgi:protein-tyrosine phosphatase